jgi:uncharacterized protein YprB with RNaseH-like and TPR domain
MSEAFGDDLRRRLARLGRAPSGRHQGPIAARPQVAQGLPAGDELSTPHGIAFRLEEHYAPGFDHGSGRLEELSALDAALVAEVAFRTGRRAVPHDRMAFIDTETTGLAGGAGTLVFLVGVGTFDETGFRLRQYFLRDPSEESAMLFALRGDLEDADCFVTFNGRVFDIPLLEMRYVMGLRSSWELTKRAQIDLLPISRRLWRNELPDCSLSTIERHVLGVRRTHEDIPGAQIPGMYLDFLRTRDGSQMSRVLYHNALDVLSLVTLTAQAVGRHQAARLGNLSSAEALAVARWHQRAGRTSESLHAYRVAIKSESRHVQLEALRRYTTYLKRLDRHAQAEESWRLWHQIAPHDPTPCVEMAKLYEWQTPNLFQAQHWALEALHCLTEWRDDWRKARARSEISHRLERIQRKLRDDG